MKLQVITITLISLICLSMATSISKIKKEKSTVTKGDYGSGTWDTGYDCPEVWIAKENGAYVLEGKMKFFAKKLENAVTEEEKIGWNFEFSALPGANLSQVLTRVSNSMKYYLPYRSMSSTLHYTNPIGYKYVEVWITTDTKIQYRLKINLPYKYIGWYISDSESLKICSLVNSSRVKHQNMVNEAKVSATESSAKYITNKALFDAASAQGSNLDSTKKLLQGQITSANDQITAIKASRATEEKIFTDLNAQALTQTAKVNEFSATMLALNNQITSINLTLNTLGASTTATADITAKLNASVNDSLALLKTNVALLKVQAINRAAECDAALAAALSINLAVVNTNLNKIVPTSA
jgi:hypothetical protein